jgi:hypothetical protein
MNYETCPEIESAVATYFNPRRCTIVPNVWWGLDLNHECDLFVMNQTGHAYEVEIKTSRADIKADQKKRHSHSSKFIRRLYFAIPEKLESSVDLIPEQAGVLIVGPSGTVRKLREARLDKEARALPLEKQLKLAQLGTMRIWSLKRSLVELARMKNIPLQEVLPL